MCLLFRMAFPATAAMQDMDNVVTKKNAAYAAFVIVSSLIFWKPIGALVAYSLNHESSSHIVLIPFVSIFLLYTQRKRIFASPRTSPGPGIGLIGAGAAIYFFVIWRPVSQDANALLPAATLSLVLIWLGAFLVFYGTGAARTAAFPLLFLLLMIPLPDGILHRIVYFLQKESTELSYLLFRATGVPVLKQGFLLYLPSVTIEVAEECSGIRSSVALLITCLLAAHLFLRTTWRKAFFVLLSVPLAVIKNGVRIVTLSLLSLYVDPSFLTGRLHREGGFVFFLLILAILVPVLRTLQKSEGRHVSTGIESDARAKEGFAGGT